MVSVLKQGQLAASVQVAHHCFNSFPGTNRAQVDLVLTKGVPLAVPAMLTWYPGTIL